jgi:flagellar basal body-associated protein FliL
MEEQPPFKVVAPTRKSAGKRLIWIPIVVVLGLILVYAAGLLR